MRNWCCRSGGPIIPRAARTSCWRSSVCSNGGPDRPREEVDLSPRATHVLVDLKAGRGLVYLVALAAQSASYDFWEGCVHLHTPHAQPFPGTVLSTGMEDYFDSAYYL